MKKCIIYKYNKYYILHINVPKIAPIIWLQIYANILLAYIILPKYTPIVTDGLICPPVNGPLIESPRK